MLLLQHGVVVETSEGLASLLGELTQPGFEEYRHLDLVRAMATRDPHFFTVINTSAGWISVRATGLGRGRVAVSLTGAEPADLFGARVAAAGLTRREIEVTRLLCSGLTDREIARELSVSEHTAHDHVRAVRAKLGVSSRARVAAMIFADHYFDAFRSSSHITSG
jgi:DNA-binding CsgD family transcriptional regulator